MRVTFSYGWRGAAIRPLSWGSTGVSEAAPTVSAIQSAGSAVPRFSPVQIVSLAVAVLALVTAASSAWLAQQGRIADQLHALHAERAAEQDKLRRTELACAQLALDLRGQADTASSDPNAMLLGLQRIIALCETAGQPLKHALLRDVRRIASRSGGGEVARVARQAERTLARATPPTVATDASGPVGDLVDIAAYGGGAVLSGTGLLNFRKHVDEPSSNDLRKSLGPGVVGVALLAFPTMAGYIGQESGFDTNPFRADF